MGLSSSRPSAAVRSTCYRVANFNTRVENFISAIFFWYERSRECKWLQTRLVRSNLVDSTSISFPPLLPFPNHFSFPRPYWPPYWSPSNASSLFSLVLVFEQFLNRCFRIVLAYRKSARFAGEDTIQRRLRLRLEHAAVEVRRIRHWTDWSGSPSRRCLVICIDAPMCSIESQMWSEPRVSAISPISHSRLLRGDRYVERCRKFFYCPLIFT